MNLIVIEGNKIFTTSLVISSGVGTDHPSVMKLLKNYQDTDILKGFEIRKVSTKGRSQEVAYLSEIQATFLVTLMKNSESVVDFKQRLVTEFYKQRRLIERLAAQKHNAEWIERRQETKVMRKECTDVIQEFVSYAKEQGSKSAEKYYMNLSRMELAGLFILEQKYPNARDVMSMRQLNLIEMADEVVAISLRESMDKKLPYKECYQEAKARIELLAKVIPKSPLPSFLEDKSAS